MNPNLEESAAVKNMPLPSGGKATELARHFNEICLEAVKLGTQTQEPFSQSLDELKDSFSLQIHEVLERLEHEAHLNQGLKQSLHRLHVIQNLCETIARCKSIQDILDTFLHMIPKIIPFSAAAVYLTNRKTGVFQLVIQQDLTPAHQEIIQSHLDEGIIPWVFSERRSVIIPFLPDVTMDSHSPGKGFVIVPLISAGNQIGFAEIWNESIQSIQKEIQLSIFDLLARQMAIAIENCELYDELREANTLLKKSQQQVIVSEKMAAIGVLASGMAHEINNPLQVIFSKIQLLKRKPTEEKLLSSMDSIERESRRISNIVSSVLRNARSQNQPEMVPLHIHTSISDVFTVAQTNLALQNIEVRYDFGDQISEILGNAGEIHQVLTNLVENARQAMKGGGTLTIQTRIRGRYLLLQVEDTGCGISSENLNRIFEPFFTTKEPNEGTGLGLFLCYQIMEHHHGKISVESTSGKGTKFTLQFPVLNPP